jgi:ribosomal protein S18 acetylase RimI-like enzyme
MSYRIRSASLPDIPAIHQIAHEVWPNAYAEVISAEQIAFMLDWMYSPSSLTEQMNNGIYFLLLEDTDSNPLGFASFRRLEGTQWKLDKLYVRSDQQQRGLGRSLIERVCMEINRLGGKQLELQVNRKNKAVEFYKRLGFEILRVEDFDIGHGFYMNDYIMGCSIE